MKIRIIKVTKCKECPYLIAAEKWMCKALFPEGKLPIILDTRKIPEWCPLEIKEI